MRFASVEQRLVLVAIISAASDVERASDVRFIQRRPRLSSRVVEVCGLGRIDIPDEVRLER